MRLSEESWVKLPLKLLKQQGMSKASAAVCCCIIDQCARAGLERWVQISTTEIAAATGYAGKTAKRAVLELERLGLIEIRRSSGSASEYRLTGCVELCPSVFKQPEQQPTPRATTRATTRTRKREKAAPQDDDMMEAYLSLVNRSLKDDDDPPLPGQLEFPQGGDAA